MSKDYKAATGKDLEVASSTASVSGVSAASKGVQNFIADLDPQQIDELDKLGLLDKYGFSRSKEKGQITSTGPASGGSPVASTTSAPSDTSSTSGGGDVAASANPAPQNFDVPEQTAASDQGGNVTVSGGGNAAGKTMSGNSKVGVANIPTYDTSDGHLLALNLGVA